MKIINFSEGKILPNDATQRRIITAWVSSTVRECWGRVGIQKYERKNMKEKICNVCNNNFKLDYVVEKTCIDCKKRYGFLSTRDKKWKLNGTSRKGPRKSFFEKLRYREFLRRNSWHQSCMICDFVPMHRCQLDVNHLNGDRHDDKFSNLELICKNCHAYKSTIYKHNTNRYKGENKHE